MDMESLKYNGRVVLAAALILLAAKCGVETYNANNNAVRAETAANIYRQSDHLQQAERFERRANNQEELRVIGIGMVAAALVCVWAALPPERRREVEAVEKNTTESPTTPFL